MPTDVASMFEPGGAIQSALGDRYEPRPEQVRMARAVADNFEQRGNLLVEAGTGVGKSFAYLLPAMDRAARLGEVVVVATNTIALQEQLVAKDIPVLLSLAMGDDAPPEGWHLPIRAELVKGRGNYLSIRRLKLASERQHTLLSDESSRRSLAQIVDWAYETEDGTLSTLGPLERPEVWEHARSDADNCMGRKCPHHAQCFYQRARQRAQQANLLICNHAIFFADLALREQGASILPRYQHVILDEAHGLEDVASEHFGLTLTEGRVNTLLRALYDPRKQRGFLAAMHGALAGMGIEREAARAIEASLEARTASRRFFEQWARLRESMPPGSGRLREPAPIADELTPAMMELAGRLGILRDAIESEPDRFELASYRNRARAIADTAGALTEQSIENAVYWVELERTRRGGTRVELGCAPIEVRELLREALFERDFSVTLTSATLTTRHAGEDEAGEQREAVFAHTMNRLGCEGARTLQLGSPFDHAHQARVFVDASAPAPGKVSTDAWVGELVPRILEHVGETDGGAFVLFTSFAALRAAGERLTPALAELDMPCLVHGRDGSRTELLDRFRASGRAVLLGADSFWQGVDIRGDALRNVIITRLPFEPPDRPLTEARGELIRQRGGDPFREDSLPRAIIRFKQGFGRLIRSSADRGRVVVLDPRLVTTRYGSLFVRALPEGIELEIIGGDGDG
ncbi:MAG: ATP-dependent DNA helicase [Phycisphaerales bacterium JB037]